MQNLIIKEKFIENHDFMFCAELSSKYEKLTKIGQGKFGEIFKAQEKNNSQIMLVVKNISMEDEGFPITALREIRSLQLLKHENVVNLLEICKDKADKKDSFYLSNICLIFEFCEYNLAHLLSNMNVQFSLGEIKKILQQLLNGLHYIHSNKILHRDVRTDNILITEKGILKLADFGLSRSFSLTKYDTPNQNQCDNQVWYHPPELLLGDRNYGSPVDLWGAGCIMAEMWTRSPIMKGNTRQQQIILISQLCGSLTPDVWPGINKLKLYKEMELPMGHKRNVKGQLIAFVQNSQGCDLLDKLLRLNPKSRIDAATALNHDFFCADPMPCDLNKMLS